MESRSGQSFQNRYKRKWRREKCGSYKFHRLQRNQSNKTVLRKVVITRPFINRICKPQGTFFGDMITQEKIEHLVTTGMIEGKRL